MPLNTEAQDECVTWQCCGSGSRPYRTRAQWSTLLIGWFDQTSADNEHKGWTVMFVLRVYGNSHPALIIQLKYTVNIIIITLYLQCYNAHLGQRHSIITWKSNHRSSRQPANNSKALSWMKTEKLNIVRNRSVFFFSSSSSSSLFDSHLFFTHSYPCAKVC